MNLETNKQYTSKDGDFHYGYYDSLDGFIGIQCETPFYFACNIHSNDLELADTPEQLVEWISDWYLIADDTPMPKNNLPELVEFADSIATI